MFLLVMKLNEGVEDDKVVIKNFISLCYCKRLVIVKVKVIFDNSGKVD